jgi:hypothetical protein
MRYLAVPEMPHQNFWASLRHRRRLAEWHAVPDRPFQAAETICGIPYASEAERTWDQTWPVVRCARCEQLMAATYMAQNTMAAAEGASLTEPGTRVTESA